MGAPESTAGSSKHPSEQPSELEKGPSALELDSSCQVQLKEGDRIYAADGSWHRAAFLMCTSVSQPTLLGLPFGIACLGWAGGMTVLIVAAIATVFCNLLLAALFEEGGVRHTTYRKLSHAILGKKAYYLTLIPQFIVIFGVGIANIVLAGQCLQAVYEFYCTDASCTVPNYVWQVVAGGALIFVAQLPDMAHAELVTLCMTGFLVTYCTVSIVLSIIHGSAGADYTILGDTVDRVMNGFNAIGIVVFALTTNIIPEVQATLRPDPVTRKTFVPMRKALVVSYSLICLLFLLVSIFGYWAYGNAVSGFLLTMFDSPKWLVATMNIMAMVQLLVGEQVFEFVLYDSWEPLLLRTLPRATWLRKARPSAKGGEMVVPSRLCMLLVRIPYIAAITALAAAFPFISELMGIIGALGLTPTSFIIPPILFLMARGPSLSRPAWWGIASVSIVFTCVGTLATIGSVRSIVVALQDHTFFS